MFLYQITNKVNNKKYFGITESYEARMQYHRTRCFQPVHKEYEKPLYRAFRKYGLENFDFKILLSDLTKEEASQQEIKMIELHKSTTHENGYNVSKGGLGGASYGEEHHKAILTEEEALDIIEKRKSGLKRSLVYAEYNEKISFGGFINVWQGRTWSHLDPEFSNREKRRDGVNNGNSIFTHEEVVIIRTKKQQGEKRITVYREILSIKKCSEASFNRVWYNKTYKNIKI